MKFGFLIEVRPRLLSLQRLIVPSDKCFGTHCAFSTSHTSPNPRGCITTSHVHLKICILAILLVFFFFYQFCVPDFQLQYQCKINYIIINCLLNPSSVWPLHDTQLYPTLRPSNYNILIKPSTLFYSCL